MWTKNFPFSTSLSSNLFNSKNLSKKSSYISNRGFVRLHKDCTLGGAILQDEWANVLAVELDVSIVIYGVVIHSIQLRIVRPNEK